MITTATTLDTPDGRQVDVTVTASAWPSYNGGRSEPSEGPSADIDRIREDRPGIGPRQEWDAEELTVAQRERLEELCVEAASDMAEDARERAAEWREDACRERGW